MVSPAYWTDEEIRRHDTRMYRPPADQPLPDLRDEEERGDVDRILSVLPEGHPALEAHQRGADTIAITHLVADRPGLIEALIGAYFAARRRIWNRAAHFRP